MLETKQLYEGAEKTPFYPKVPLQALSGIAPNTTLEDNVKTISKTVYGTEVPGVGSNNDQKINTVPEVYAFLDGIKPNEKLNDLIADGVGGKVVVRNTFAYGTRVATIVVGENSTDINVPNGIDLNKFKLDYDQYSTRVSLSYNNLVIASTQITSSGDGGEHITEYSTPIAPQNLTATYITDDSEYDFPYMLITWDPVYERIDGSTSSEKIYTYELKEVTDGVESGVLHITISENATVFGYIEGDKTDGTTYQYKVRAVSAHAGEHTEVSPYSEWSVSNEVTTPSSGNPGSEKSISTNIQGEATVNGVKTIMLNPNGSYNMTVNIYGDSSYLNLAKSIIAVLGSSHPKVAVPTTISIDRTTGKQYKSVNVSFTSVDDLLPDADKNVSVTVFNDNEATYPIYTEEFRYNVVYPIFCGYVDPSVYDDSTLPVSAKVNTNHIANQVTDSTILNKVFTLTASNEEIRSWGSNSWYAQIAIPLILDQPGQYKWTAADSNYETVMKPTTYMTKFGKTYNVYTTESSYKYSAMQTYGHVQLKANTNAI